jgi:fructose-1,6-bisphosphatase/inositol monophosphatase family enzyme
VWIVDPLDSTSNFTECGDEYSVSIGLAVDGRAALGIVYNPARGDVRRIRAGGDDAERSPHAHQ